MAQPKKDKGKKLKPRGKAGKGGAKKGNNGRNNRKVRVTVGDPWEAEVSRADVEPRYFFRLLTTLTIFAMIVVVLLMIGCVTNDADRKSAWQLGEHIIHNALGCLLGFLGGRASKGK